MTTMAAVLASFNPYRQIAVEPALGAANRNVNNAIVVCFDCQHVAVGGAIRPNRYDFPPIAQPLSSPTCSCAPRRCQLLVT